MNWGSCNKLNYANCVFESYLRWIVDIILERPSIKPFWCWGRLFEANTMVDEALVTRGARASAVNRTISNHLHHSVSSNDGKRKYVFFVFPLNISKHKCLLIAATVCFSAHSYTNACLAYVSPFSDHWLSPDTSVSPSISIAGKM